MKGLLIKDIKIMLKSIKFILFMLALAAVATFRQKDSLSVIFMYTTIVFSILAVNTLAYDEHDKSIIFLMTLPINRSTYIKEKYLIALISGLLGFLFPTVISIALHPGQVIEVLAEGASVCITMFLFQMIVIPLRLKLGNEKSSAAILGFVFFCFVAFGIFGAAVSRINESHTWFSLSAVKRFAVTAAEAFFSLSPLLIAAIIALFLIACFAVSFLISIKIMRRREF